jgi:GNAT superfamily N-acetyltransferase
VTRHVVRLATLTDLETLVELMRHFHAEADAPFSEASATRSFETLLDDSRLGQVWVIEYDGHPAGFVVLTVSFSMQSGGLRGLVEDFYIAPPFRRRGLGHAALEEVKRACVRRGVRALLVESGSANEAALSAYRSVGFVDSGQCLLTLALAPADAERRA